MKKTKPLSGVFATFACGIMMTSCVLDVKTTRTESYEDENGDSVVVTTKEYSYGKTKTVKIHDCKVTIDGREHPELQTEEDVKAYLKNNKITNYTTKTNTNSFKDGNGNESVQTVIEVTTN